MYASTWITIRLINENRVILKQKERFCNSCNYKREHIQMVSAHLHCCSQNTKYVIVHIYLLFVSFIYLRLFKAFRWCSWFRGLYIQRFLLVNGHYAGKDTQQHLQCGFWSHLDLSQFLWVMPIVIIWWIYIFKFHIIFVLFFSVGKIPCRDMWSQMRSLCLCSVDKPSRLIFIRLNLIEICQIYFQ